MSRALLDMGVRLRLGLYRLPHSQRSSLWLSLHQHRILTLLERRDCLMGKQINQCLTNGSVMTASFHRTPFSIIVISLLGRC